MAAQQAFPFAFHASSTVPYPEDSQFVEFVEEPQVKPKKSSYVEPSFEMWRMRKDDPSGSQKLSWRRATKDRLPFDSDEVAKTLHKLEKKSSGIQVYRDLSEVKQQLVNVLIEDKNSEERNSNAQWTLGHIDISDQKPRSERKGAMYVILQRRDVRGTSVPEKQIKRDPTPANVIDLTERMNAARLNDKPAKTKRLPEVHLSKRHEDHGAPGFRNPQPEATLAEEQGWVEIGQAPPPPVHPSSPANMYTPQEVNRPEYSPAEQESSMQPMSGVTQQGQTNPWMAGAAPAQQQNQQYAPQEYPVPAYNPSEQRGPMQPMPSHNQQGQFDPWMTGAAPAAQQSQQQAPSVPPLSTLNMSHHTPWQPNFDWKEVERPNSGHPSSAGFQDEMWSTSGKQSTAPTSESQDFYEKSSLDGMFSPKPSKTYRPGSHASSGAHGSNYYDQVNATQEAGRTQHGNSSSRRSRSRERKSGRRGLSPQIHQDYTRRPHSRSPPRHSGNRGRVPSYSPERRYEDRHRDDRTNRQPTSPMRPDHHRKDSFYERYPDRYDPHDRYRTPSPPRRDGRRRDHDDLRGWTDPSVLRQEAERLAKAAERVEQEQREKQDRDQEVYEKARKDILAEMFAQQQTPIFGACPSFPQGQRL